MQQTGTRCFLQLLRLGGRPRPIPTKFSGRLGKVRYYSVAQSLADTSSQSSQATGKWQIVGAVCITRLPVICQQMSPLEKELSELLEKLEVDISLKSDHELRLEQDIIRAELQKTNEFDDMELEESSFQTALEYEDLCAEELNAVTLAPTVTEADKSGDLKTLNRELDRALVLVVNQKLGKEHQWIFPQSPLIPGETLRQTCERLVQEKCGTDLNVKFLGNAPCGFYKYKYPRFLQAEGYIGAKVFFYKCQVRGTRGEVQPGSDIAEHQWLTLDQLDSKLKNSYAKSVAKFLVSDK